MVSLEDHSVESTWLITLVDESAKWAIPFLIGLQAKENTNCNSPQFRLFAAATADSHRCPGNTPTWWTYLCSTSVALILINALRSQQLYTLYLNCRNPTMWHFQWESHLFRVVGWTRKVVLNIRITQQNDEMEKVFGIQATIMMFNGTMGKP